MGAHKHKRPWKKEKKNLRARDLAAVIGHDPTKRRSEPTTGSTCYRQQKILHAFLFQNKTLIFNLIDSEQNTKRHVYQYLQSGGRCNAKLQFNLN